ncbi:MAG: LysE family transporter [Chloroflexi bacterium]|jgi:threonine/homoserine/homoserine lactone efflux protein|nr:LysE family transporter [Chloroflexota bacterium]
MDRAFIAGVVAGYGIAIPVGAIAVLIIDAGLRHGFRTAVAAGAGAAGADVLYATVAAIFGAALAQVLEPIAVPLRVASVVLLVAIGARGLLAARRDARTEPGAVTLPPGAARTFTTFLGLTLLNPMTVVYFAALILGLASTGAGPAEKAAFVAGAGLASLSWQELIAFVGSRLHRRLSPRARAATGILGNLVVIGLAVSIAIPLVAGSG